MFISNVNKNMANANSYYLYQKYEKRGDQPWIPVFPSTYSVDGDGTMPLVVKQLNDQNCFIEPHYRWVESGTTCLWGNLYKNNIKQISTDSGSTWSNTNITSASTLLDRNCADCGYRTRWVNSGTTCVGYDKYRQKIKQESIDNGLTWNNVFPEEYSATTLIEANSISCGYGWEEITAIEKKDGYIGNVDLGLQLTQNFKIIIKFNYKQPNGGLLIGEGGRTRFFKESFVTYLDLRTLRIYNIESSFCPLNTDLTFEIGNRYMKNLEKDWTTTGSSITYTPQNNLIVFSNDSNDLAVVYYVKVYDGDTLVGDFIPARKTDTNEVTMYNKITGTLCTTNGTLYGVE